MEKLTNKDAIRHINEIGCPEHDHPENDGRVPWAMVNRYGEWLYRHDKTAFYCAKQDIQNSL